MAEHKRVRRTSAQIAADLDIEMKALEDSIQEIEAKKIACIAEYDQKIAGVHDKIAKLKERQKTLLTPKKRQPRRSKAEQIKDLVKQAQKSGMKLDEIASKLGVELES